jgi:hypothetical protein
MSILRGNFSRTIWIPTITKLNQKWNPNLSANLNRQLAQNEETKSKSGRQREPAPIFDLEQRDIHVLDDALDQSMTHEAQGPRARYVAELAEISALSTADLIDEAVF